MNTDTGQISDLSKLSKKQLISGKWVEISQEENVHLRGMNREQRRKWLKDNGKFKGGFWSRK